MYDYKMKIDKDGRSKQMGYQEFINKAGIQDEIVHGAPLSEGGTPQAQTVAGLIKGVFKADKVVVYFQGQPILTA